MPKMISLQNLRLDTVEGAVLRFKPNVPTYVPPRAVAAALAKGCAHVDEKDRTFHEDMSRARVDFSGELRQSLLFLAVNSLMEKNNPKDFDGGGVPLAAAVTDLVGFDVAGSEMPPIHQLWHQVQDGAEFTLHENANQVQNVMEASSKAELLEIAKGLELEDAEVKSLNVKPLRKLLLTKLSGYAPE